MRVKAHKRSKQSATRPAASAPSQAVIGTGGRTWPHKLKRLLTNRYMVVFMVGFLFVALVGGGAIIVRAQYNHQAEQRAQRQQEILTIVAPSLVNADPHKLDSTIEKIKQQPDYDTDQNYLYVVTKYYIDLSDAQNARRYYDKLAVVYTSDEAYSEIIRPQTLPLSELQRLVESLEKHARSFGELSTKAID